MRSNERLTLSPAALFCNYIGDTYAIASLIVIRRTGNTVTLTSGHPTALQQARELAGAFPQCITREYSDAETLVIRFAGLPGRPAITLAEARQTLRALGLVIRKRDGEYRVAFPRTMANQYADTEASAYYTNDLQDAIDTGRAMAAQASKQ